MFNNTFGVHSWCSLTQERPLGGGIVAKTVRPEISMVKVLRIKFVAKNGKFLF